MLLILGVTSCYYDSEEDIYGTIECSTEDVTYTAVVQPILQDNCYNCHDAARNFGNITIEGYDKLKPFVDNDQLLGAIKHESGYSSMPKNKAQLLQCDIEKIEKWILEGALNN